MNDFTTASLILVLFILIVITGSTGIQIAKQTELLKQQIEISQQINQKLKILTLEKQ